MIFASGFAELYSVENFPMTRLLQSALIPIVRIPFMPSILAGTWHSRAGPIQSLPHLSSLAEMPVFCHL